MARLKLTAFGPSDPLSGIGNGQSKYLRCYLSDLDCRSVVEEPTYFDGDYLAEFAAFYCSSVGGYNNVCRRLHFFDIEVSRALLRRAAGGNPRSQERLRRAYLGFSVIRPIPMPIGRTVLRWYDDLQSATPRRIASRSYKTHLLGMEFSVEGLAWQQQDTGVGACATVALWSMLHSSAFDDSYAIPTTAEITLAAHKRASLGDRVFPSKGLKTYQLLEAIKEFGLTPVAIIGDLPAPNGGVAGFSRRLFATVCASMIRSGYPVLLAGDLAGAGGHAQCVVGFREAGAIDAGPGQVAWQDEHTEYVYVHDDNLGPNVRFEVNGGVSAVDGAEKPVELAPCAPPRRYVGPPLPSPTSSYPAITPKQLICGVHAGLRTTPLPLHEAAVRATRALQNNLLMHTPDGPQQVGLTMTARFARIDEYVGRGLGETIGGQPLTRARIALAEEVAPMSLRVGVVRIGRGHVPVADVLFDTSDLDREHGQLRSFCAIAFASVVRDALELANGAGLFNYGAIVTGY